jgi:U3 small nucleolar RNA-associated protein 20
MTENNNELSLSGLVGIYMSILTSLNQIKIADINEFLLLLKASYTSLKGYLSTAKLNEYESTVGRLLIGQVIQTYSKLYMSLEKDSINIDDLIEFYNDIITDILPNNAKSNQLISGLIELIELIKYSAAIKSKKLELANLEGLVKVYNLTQDNICHFDKALRTKTLHLYTQFELGEEEMRRLNGENPFELAYTMENIAYDLSSYQSRLNTLKRVVQLQLNGVVPKEFHHFPLKLCVSQFTINFVPLWNESVKYIAQLIQGPSGSELLDWVIDLMNSVENGNLKQAYLNYKLVVDLMQPTPIDNLFNNPAKSFLFNFLNSMSLGDNTNKLVENSNEILFNALNLRSEDFDTWSVFTSLLNTITKVPTESINKESVQRLFNAFLAFYSKFRDIEVKRDESMILKVKESTNSTVENINEEEEKDDDDEEEIIEEEEDSDESDESRSRPMWKHMYQFLDLVANLPSPKSLPNFSEISDIYQTLLMHTDLKIQQKIVVCFKPLKYNFLNPYFDQLTDLLEDGKVRDIMINFSLAQSANTIEFSHRQKLLPFITKVLYGRLVCKKTKKGSQSHPQAKRAAILSYLSGMDWKELGNLFDLYTTQYSFLLKNPKNNADAMDYEFQFDSDLMEEMKSVPIYKHFLFLNLLPDLLTQLGGLVLPYYHQLLVPLLYLINYSTNHFEYLTQVQKHAQAQQYKKLRNLGYKRLVKIFQVRANFDFSPYISQGIFGTLDTKLANFSQENSQSPSALMELFMIWAQRTEFAPYLWSYKSELMPQMINILSAKSVQPRVIHFIFDWLEQLILLKFDEVKDEDSQHQKRIIKHDDYFKLIKIDELKGNLAVEEGILPNVAVLLNNLHHVMNNSWDLLILNKYKLFQKCIQLLSVFACKLDDKTLSYQLLQLLIPCLEKGEGVVPYETKAQLLTIILENLRKLGFAWEELKSFYLQLTKHFFSLDHRVCRTILADITVYFSSVNSELVTVAELLVELNSYSKRRLDEPDFDRRLKAYQVLDLELSSKLSPLEWHPILCNALYNVMDENEMSLRNSGTYCIKRYLEEVKSLHDQGKSAQSEPLLDQVLDLIFPLLKRGIQNTKSEVVIEELFRVFGHHIELIGFHSYFKGLRNLLSTEKDGELLDDNFFYNVLHHQIHKRILALAKLSSVLSKHHNEIQLEVVQAIFLPLCLQFCLNSKDSNLVHESGKCITQIVQLMPWYPFFGLYRRQLSAVKRATPEEEASLVKLLVYVLDGFHFEVTQEDLDKGYAQQSIEQNQASQKANENEDNEDNEGEDGREVAGVKKNQETKVTAFFIHTVVLRHLIPQLSHLLDHCPDNSIQGRIPLALGITKILKKFPESTIRNQLPGLLTKVCQFLKSRQVKSRDVTRDTLVKLNGTLGPKYFFFLVNELKTALGLGYQRHVLGYTLHTLLDSLKSQISVGDIDDSSEVMISIVINDLFGQVSEEKDAEGYTGKSKEMKSKKGYDCFELISSLLSFSQIHFLLNPIKDLLRSTESSSILQKIDQCLQRISLGLIKNKGFHAKSILTFSYGLVSQSIKVCQPAEDPLLSRRKIKKTRGPGEQYEKTFTVQTQRPKNHHEFDKKDHFAINGHKLIEFGLNLFITCFKKDKLNVEQEEMLKLLNPFINLLGESLFSQHDGVVSLGLKGLNHLIPLPLPGLDAGLPVIVQRILKLINFHNSTLPTTVQDGFRLLAPIIEQFKNITLSEKEVIYLIDLIQPDLLTFQRQYLTFKLLKAIISRKFMVSKVYDIMEEVQRIMVTNGDSAVRKACQSLFLDFFHNYPQGQQRLKTSLTFLCNNLQYEFESGRETVLETLFQMLNKGYGFFKEFGEMIFLSLTMVLINDDSSNCREMSASLLTQLFSILDPPQLNLISEFITKWLKTRIEFDLEEDKNTSFPKDLTKEIQLRRTGIQISGLFVQGLKAKSQPQLKLITNAIKDNLQLSLSLLERAIELNSDVASSLTLDLEDQLSKQSQLVPTHWELGYYSLNALVKVLAQFPKLTTSKELREVWELVLNHLNYPHQWIRSLSGKLIGLLFSQLNVDETIESFAKDYQKSSNPQEFWKKNVENDEFTSISNLLWILNKTLAQFITNAQIQDTMADQWLKNVLFGLKFFYKVEQITKSEEELTAFDYGFETEEVNGHADEDSQNAKDEDNDSEDEDEDDSDITMDARTKYLTKNLDNPVKHILDRLSTLARRDILKTNKTSKRSIIVKLFAALTSFMSVEHMIPHLVPVIYPIYITLQDPSVPTHHKDLHQLTQQVQELLKNKLGIPNYTRATNEVYRLAQKKKQERKEGIKQLALVNPQKAAERKVKKGEQLKNKRKRVQKTEGLKKTLKVTGYGNSSNNKQKRQKK